MDRGSVSGDNAVLASLGSGPGILDSDSRPRPRHDLTPQTDALSVDIAAQPGPKG